VEFGVATSYDDREGTETLAWHAESRRRDGDHEAALSLALEALARDPSDLAARATAALAALDLGRDAEVRRLLESLVARPAELVDDGSGIGDSELDLAFAEAAPEMEVMRDANALAFDAIRAAALDAPEGLAAPDPESPFHTRTMAALLERQGDRATADSIRVSLARREHGAPRDAAPGRRREDRIRILERWLERTRRGDA
jgi:hypothetical protein